MLMKNSIVAPTGGGRLPNSHSFREEFHMRCHPTTATTSSTNAMYTKPRVLERLWRIERHNFVVFFSSAYVIYGYQPQVGRVGRPRLLLFEFICRLRTAES